MKKLVVIINGAGGAGKDTIVNVVARHYKVTNRSSIDPIKEAAKICGVDPPEFKWDQGRKLLSDLKMLFSEYNDYPMRYMLGRFAQFMQGDSEVLFMHVREPDEIEKLRREIKRLTREPSYFLRVTPDVRVCTLLIRGRESREFGNIADDGVEDYSYDYTYENSGKLENLENDFIPFFEKILEEQERI